ncbi:MAG: LysM peptidoglycan-binding domain-containing protein [Anaerolineae bacterium]
MRKEIIALLVLLSACAAPARPTPALSPTPTLGPSPTSLLLPSPSPTLVIYVVQPGDTLADIAALYGTTAEAICAFNELPDCSLIYPGDELRIPGEGVALPSATKAAPSPIVATPEAPLPTPTEEAAPLPPPQDLGPVSAEGNAELEIDNDTPYVLTLEFQGPTSHTVSIERCPECKEYSLVGPIFCPSGRPSATFRLPPGTYEVTARVDKPGVTSFAGTWELAGDRSYGYCFYIVSQFR